jgi:hypothetical protein
MHKLIEDLLKSNDDNIRRGVACEIAALKGEGTDIIISALKEGSDIRALLLALSRIIDKKAPLERLKEVWKSSYYKPLKEYIKSEDPKVRKSAYVIAGEINDISLKAALIEALKDEKTVFLLSSVILAIGKYDCTDISETLTGTIDNIISSYDTPENAKHIAAIRDASEKAFSKYKLTNKHIFKGLNSSMRIALTPMEGQEAATLNETKLFYNSKLANNKIIVETQDYEGLFRIRSFYDALIAPLTLERIPNKPDRIGRALAGAIPILLLNSWHEGSAPFGYRITTDFKGSGEYISALKAEIDKAYKGALINSPSAYELEFIIERAGENTVTVYLKLYTFKDKRFDYRVNALPASIKGETAAVCMRLLLPYLKQGASVLDPFAGTGTMLIERAKAVKAEELAGVDIFGQAVIYARENSRTAGESARFFKSDIIEFTPSHRYDEIISNMPYGLRVGTHRENEELYRNFIARVPYLLKPEGTLILLTADYKLLSDEARRAGLKTVNEFTILSGGLMPRLAVFKLK